MLESIINPKRLEKGPLKMLFVGIVYASLSLLLVKWFFLNDPILYDFAGMIVVTFTVMFSLPFMYFLIKKEEEEDELIEGFFGVWKMHKDAVFAFMWLFLGFLIAFSFWFIILQDENLFNAQIGTYCTINSPGNVENCIAKYAFDATFTGSATSEARFVAIIVNNIYCIYKKPNNAATIIRPIRDNQAEPVLYATKDKKDKIKIPWLVSSPLYPARKL